MQAAWQSAEPGVLFWDTIKERSPADIYAQEGYSTQSTNPCLVSSTKIAVADGRGTDVTIGELASTGKDVPVYCQDNRGKVTVRMMRNPRLTKKNSKILKVKFDDGSTIRVTENHKIMLKSGEYKRADELSPGDSIHVALRRELALDDLWKNSNSRSSDYIWMKSGNASSHKSEHRLIYEFHNGEIPKGHVIHHCDIDSKNNRLDNLLCMTKEDHDELHASMMLGDNNPMRRAQAEWSEEKWEKYRSNMSASTSGLKNGNSSGISSDEFRNTAIQWISDIGYVPTNEEFRNHFFWSDYREKTLGCNLGKFIRECSLQAVVNTRVTNPRTADDLMVAYYRSRTELPLKFDSKLGVVVVKKTCEHCGADFEMPASKREVAFCSIECSLKYVNSDSQVAEKRNEGINWHHSIAAQEKNENQLKVYTDLKFELNRVPKYKEWENECKDKGVVYRLGTKHGFSTWSELKQEANSYNHRVVSVAEDGYEDVYTGTVDEFHNYYTYGNEGTSKFEKPEWPMFCNKQCGEIVLSPYDSCRLMVVNLSRFVRDPFTENALFDWEAYGKAVYNTQRLMDDMIDLEIEKVDAIIEKIQGDPEPDHIKQIELDLWQKIRKAAVNGRRTGTGITALGDVIAALNMTYGDEHSIEFTERIYCELKLHAYMSTIDMAAERGAFPVFNLERDKQHPFIQEVLSQLPQEYVDRYHKHGRRNIALTTTAPTGSVSVLTQTTSGIEPTFMTHYTRRRKINPSDARDKGLTVDFVDELGDSWTEYTVFHHWFKRYLEVKHPDNIDPRHFNASPYKNGTANDVDWVASVDIQAAAQGHICHAISKTCNLPANVTVDLVSDVYMRAWETGCKGFTIYRDGSRSGVLVTTPDESKADHIVSRNAPKRPEELPCEIHHANIKGEKWTILVGLMDGRPYEVLGGLSERIELPRKHTIGVISKTSYKTKNARYDLVIGEGDEQFTVRNLVDVFDNPNHSAFTRTISLSLRHGVPINYLVEQLQKDKDADMFSFSRVVARTLKKYIEDGTEANGVKMEGCETPDKCDIKYIEGCATCAACGLGFCG